MPLMRYQTGVNFKEASFTIRSERLALAVLEGNTKEIERQKKSIAEMVDHLPRSLELVRTKEEQLNTVLSRPFWNDLSFSDARMLVDDIAPLMKYMRKETPKTIVIDMGDVIEERTQWEVDEEAPAYVTAFVKKVEERIREMATDNPVMQKIANDEPITEEDLSGLEIALSDAGVAVTEETLQRGYRQPQGTLVDFIKSVLGLYQAPDPKKKIDEAFQTFMIMNNRHYTADQLHFIRMIQTVFMRKKHIEMTDLWEAPFTNFGVSAPMPMFDEGDLREFIGICQGLERELFVAEA